MLNYAEIKCPKCGESFFEEKQHNTDFGFDIIPAVFKTVQNPIYKNGILQNPPKIEPVKKRFKCLACGCNFRAEIQSDIEDTGSVPIIIDEDKEYKDSVSQYIQSQIKAQQKITPSVDLVTMPVNNEYPLAITASDNSNNSVTISSEIDAAVDKIDDKIELLTNQVKELQDKISQLEVIR